MHLLYIYVKVHYRDLMRLPCSLWHGEIQSKGRANFKKMWDMETV